MKTIKELRRKVCKKEYDKLRYLKVIKVDRKVNKLKEKIYQTKFRNLNKEKINEKNRNRNKKKKSLLLEWDYLNPCVK